MSGCNPLQSFCHAHLRSSKCDAALKVNVKILQHPHSFFPNYNSVLGLGNSRVKIELQSLYNWDKLVG